MPETVTIELLVEPRRVPLWAWPIELLHRAVFGPPAVVGEEQKLFAAAFTEWDRRYREEPERFQSEAARLLKSTPTDYGEAAAPYFIQILDELST